MSTPPSLRDLQAQYTTKLAQYDARVADALARNDTTALPDLRRRNEELSSLLNQMLNSAVGNPQTLRIQREELVQTLNRIENDYTGLAKSTDALERLRMLRRTQTGVEQKTFNWYLFLFILACVGILFMAFFVPQNILATSMRPVTPASTAPLV